MRKKILLILFVFFAQFSFGQFITTWEISSANSSIRIPVNTDYTYNYNVDWGDGTTSANQTGDADHTFATPGTYTVTITGTFPAIYFNSIERNVNSIDPFSRQAIRTVSQWGNNPWQSMRRAFSGCSMLTITATDTPNLSNVTDMGQMFYSATQINADIGGWDVSNVTNMGALFYQARNFNQDISSWDVGNVTNMSFMFYSANDFNQDIGNWNVGNVTDMSLMFRLASSFNQDISSWDVANVTDMSQMFSNAIIFNQDIGNWNVSNVTDMSEMFFGNAVFDQNIGNWNVSKVTDMSEMFNGASAFNQDISNWDVSKVTNMSEMFSDASSFNQNIGGWNVSSVTDMSQMLSNAIAFNQNIGNWNVSNVTDMSNMFYSATAFNQNIADWVVSSVTDMSNMFGEATAFNQPIGSWNVSNVTDMSGMFSEATFFDQDLSSWNTENVESTSYMFEDASAFDQSLGSWNISKVTDMSDMLSNSGLSIANYDATLIGWAAQTVSTDVYFSADGLKYCNGATARTTLTSTPNNWTIEDAGEDCSSSATVSIPDANFEQALIDFNIDSDGVINQQVLASDIAGVTTLSIGNRNISDLTGIAGFTSLEVLRVFDNSLTTLDVSQNVELKDLRCFNNQLTALDVSANTKLEDLRCFDNNITMLDLSNNGLLESIKVYNNSLSSLNVKNGNNSNITTFEATGNTSLTCIDVDDVNYATNNWVDIDSQTSFSTDCSSTGGNTVSIPDIYFEDYLESIGAGNGIDFDGLVDADAVSQLTSIDLSSVATVESLSGIEFFTSLVTLNASGNSISTVDLSANTSLQTLDISQNNLTTLDISNNTKLTSLNVSNNSLTSIDVTALPDLEILRCASNQLTELDVTQNTQLIELNCNSNSLVNLNVLSNINLEELYCEQNTIEYLDLSQNSGLRTLTCILNSLVGLNIKNGNNTLITNANFAAFDNPNLSCIQVDDVSYSNSNWGQIDMASSFSENCTPVNDDCSFTIPIVLGQDTPGDTTSASAGSNNPNCAQSGIVLFDVWYQVTAPASGSIVLSLSAQPLVAKIAIYDSCSQSQPFACDQDTLSVDNLTPGQTYYLQVWLETSSGGRNASGETGAFTINAQDASVLSTTDIHNTPTTFEMYPNPAGNEVYVRLHNNEEITSVIIYSLIGTKVLEVKNSSSNSIDISQFPKGIYIVKIKGTKGLYSKKLIKE